MPWREGASIRNDPDARGRTIRRPWFVPLGPYPPVGLEHRIAGPRRPLALNLLRTTRFG
jgi:hypothetical protein